MVKMPHNQAFKSASVAVAQVASAAVVAALSAAPLVGPDLRSDCEKALGAAMSMLASSEGQRPAIAAEKLRSEIVPAFRAGMTVAEIAFCLDLSPAAVRFFLPPAVFDGLAVLPLGASAPPV